MTEQQFICPECDHAPFPTIKGWKRHMTSAHMGATAEQVAEAMGGNNEGIAITGEQSLESAIEDLPLTENGLQADEPTPEEREQRRTATKEQKAAAKRVKLRFESLRQKVSGDVPEQAFKFAGIELDDKEKQWLAESIDTTFDVFGVNFEIEPWNLTIRNPFLILLYPLLVIAIITIGKIMQAKKEQDNPDETH